MIILLAFAITIKSILAGFIHSNDIVLDYSNANYLSLINVKFKLDSTLSINDYLKIAFPFKLHNQINANPYCPNSFY